MEYVVNICNDICDTKYIKHVGYSQTSCSLDCGPSCIHKYFSPENIRMISNKISELLMGVDEKNRKIIVPDSSICNIMSAVYDNYRPRVGDIYSRYIIPQDQEDTIQTMIDQVINIITTDVKVNLGMQQCNRKLSVWTTVMGDFNEHGLRQHPPIKLREKRPQPMMFNMNY